MVPDDAHFTLRSRPNLEEPSLLVRHVHFQSDRKVQVIPFNSMWDPEALKMLEDDACTSGVLC